jgi:uridine kinase
VITAALRATAPRAGRTTVLAIDGRSGSGKTTLAAALKGELRCPLVTLEDLYGGWDGLERGIALLVREVLQPLATGRPAAVPRYDWTTGQWAAPVVLPVPAMLIVEGAGAGARAAAAYASLLVWVEAPEDTRRKRALDRDGELYEPFWDQWAAQEDRMLARELTPERAGIRVSHG